MPPKVILSVIKGKLEGLKFSFDERTTRLIGRAFDCDPRLPDDDAHKTISRHHCMLDINPPDIRVRDFGSLNGTFVNGKKIGMRPAGVSAAETSSITFPEHDLKDGDEIKLGETTFKIEVKIPHVCQHCGQEIPEEIEGECSPGEGVYLCPSCQGSTRMLDSTKPGAITSRKCAKCGRDVVNEAANRNGVYICMACRKDPLDIVHALIEKANGGDEGVAGVKGYSIIKELGRGGMGAVYLARRESDDHQVALKVMLPQVAADERSKDMFLREVENARAVDHPNVVRLLETGYSGGVFYFTMEFCDLGSLEGLMKSRKGTLPVDEAVEIALQALDGLDAIHNATVNVKLADGTESQAKGLVHRDIKPANIFLSGAGGKRTAKIADVGLGKAFDLAGLSGQTMTGSSAGTPLFMPRQQVINFKYAKPDVDVWAIAATLYSMMTGSVPRDFPRGKDPWQIVLQNKAVPIRDRNPNVPEKLAKVIDMALIDQPDMTFKSAVQLKKAIEEAV
ncbi:MAG: protein kinase [Nitrospinae bacterium]|nr:protein kinase [Nitrospinota bacterium]